MGERKRERGEWTRRGGERDEERRRSTIVILVYDAYNDCICLERAEMNEERGW